MSLFNYFSICETYCTLSSKQIDWERAKRYSWYYDDDNKTPILHLQAPNTHEVAEAVCESIKDYFRK